MPDPLPPPDDQPFDYQAYFKQLAEKNGLRHVAYFAHTIPRKPNAGPIAWVTYSPDWVERYFEKRYQRIDPIAQVDRRTLLPVDWDQLKSDDKATRAFFGEAEDFGVGRHGLAVPIRGPLGDRAIFAVSTDMSASEWRSVRRAVTRELLVVGHFVHQRAMESIGLYMQREDVKLSPREAECLQWAAGGKTIQDIATILSLSERVVRGYLDTARHKLNAINIAQAVGRGISAGLISPG